MILDISPGGLSFSYLPEKTPVDGFKYVEIYQADNKFRLSDVPCAIVYDTVDSAIGSKGDTCRRCGLRFGQMKDEHKNKLNYFLSNFTTGLKKDWQLRTTAVNKLRSARRYAFPLLIDFLLLTVALFGVQLAKRQSLKMSMLYIGLYVVFYLFWLAISLIMEKYRKIFQKTFFEAIVVIVKSNIALVYLISFAAVLWSELSAVSRMQTFGVCAAFLLLELAAYSLYYLFHKIHINGRRQARPYRKETIPRDVISVDDHRCRTGFGSLYGHELFQKRQLYASARVRSSHSVTICPLGGQCDFRQKILPRWY